MASLKMNIRSGLCMIFLSAYVNWRNVAKHNINTIEKLACVNAPREFQKRKNQTFGSNSFDSISRVRRWLLLLNG
jgi:hypothetical protein